MKCKDCKYLTFADMHNCNPNRYYCENPIICKERERGAVMICRCERGTSDLKIKTSPRWCPLKNIKE